MPQQRIYANTYSQLRIGLILPHPPYRLNSVNLDNISQPSHYGLGFTVLYPTLAQSTGRANSQVVSEGWGSASYTRTCYAQDSVLLQKYRILVEN